MSRWKKSGGPQKGGNTDEEEAQKENVKKATRLMPDVELYAQYKIPGPWFNKPLSGSPWQALLEIQNGGKKPDPKEYPWVNYPVFLLNEKLSAAADSQCSAAARLEAQHNAFLRRRALENEPEALRIAETMPSSTFSSSAHDEQRFGTGNVAWFARAADKPEPPSATGIKKDLDTSPRWYYHLVLTLPTAMYNDPPRHLLDFNNTKRAKEFGIVASFVMQAMSNLSVAPRPADNEMGANFMLYKGQLQKRVRVFVETVLSEHLDGLEEHLGFDPETAGQIDQFKQNYPPVNVLSALNLKKYRRSYRVHWLIFCPLIHPATLMKAQVYINKYEKGTLEVDDLDRSLRTCIQNRGFQQYVAEKREKEKKEEADNEAKQLKALKNLQKGRQKPAAGKPAAKPAAAQAPIEAAAEAAEAVADAVDPANDPVLNLEDLGEAPAPAAHEGSDSDETAPTEDEEDAEEEEEEDSSNDSDEAASDEDELEEGDMAEVGEPGENEAEEAAEVQAALEAGQRAPVLQKGKKNKKKPASKKAVIKQSADDVPHNVHMGVKGMNDAREQHAEASPEPNALSSYRLIQNMTNLSTNVFHPYNKLAQSQLAIEHPDGVYEAGVLSSMEYDLHHASAGLHYLRTFSLAIAIDVEMRQDGTGTRIMPSQADRNNYYHGPECAFSFPHPLLVREMDIKHTRPEYLAQYSLPSGSGQVEAQCRAIEMRAAQHVRLLTQLRMAREDISMYKNRNLIESQPLVATTRADKDIQDKLNATIAKFECDEGEEDADPEPASKVAKTVTLKDILGFAYSGTVPASVPSAMVAPEPQKLYSQLRSDEQVALAMQECEQLGVGTDRGTIYSEDTNHLSLGGLEQTVRKKSTEEIILMDTGDLNQRKRLNSQRAQEERNALHRMADINKLSRAARDSGVAGLIETVRDIKEIQDAPLNTVEDLRRIAANSFGTPDFFKNVQAIFEHPDPGVQDLLSQLSKSKVDLDNETTKELRESFVNAIGNRTANLAKLVRGDEEASDRRLTSVMIQGPIAKLREKMLHIRVRIMTTIAALPFKTEITELANWLRMTYGWRPANEDPKALKTQVLAEMTPQRENMYRQDALCRLMSMFREEASSQLLTMLDMGNKELSDVHLGMLKWKQKRGDTDVFCAPRFSIDPSLELFANGTILDLAHVHAATNLGDETGLLLLQLRNQFRHLACREGADLPQAMVIQGPAGVGKSNLLQQLEYMSLSGAMRPSDHESKLASAVPKAQDYMTVVYDEAQQWMVGDPARMSHAEQETRNQKKSTFTKQKYSYQRNVQNPLTGERELENVNVSQSHQLIMLVNYIDGGLENSALDRTRRHLLLPRGKKTGSIQDRVMALQFQSENSGQFREQFYCQSKDEQYIMQMIVTMQNVMALPLVNKELHAVYMGEFLRELKHWMPQIKGGISNRAMMRSFNDAEAATMHSIYHRVFRSEISSFINYSRDPTDRKRIVGDAMDPPSPFNPSQLLDLVGPLLYVSAPVSLYCLTDFFKEIYSLTMYEILMVIACEMFNFTRDFFAPCYKRFKIPLPDLDQRARERGFSQGAYEHCGFLQDFRRFEQKLLRRVAERTVAPGNTRPWPTFLKIMRATNRTAGDATASYDAEDDDPKKKAASGNRRTEQCLVEEFDPSYLSFRGTPDELTRQAVHVVAEYFPTVDYNAVRTAVNFMQTITVHIPVHKRVNVPNCSNMVFEGIKEATVGSDTWEGEVSKKSVESVQYTKERNRTLISTHFFMIPWHEILYMGLSAPENGHSRHFDTVLPICVSASPDLIHRWQARSNRFHEVSIANMANAVPARNMADLLVSPVYSAFAHTLPGHAIPDGNVLAQRAQVASLPVDCDLEEMVFRGHLSKTQIQPVSYKLRATHAPDLTAYFPDLNIISDPDQRLAEVAQKHPAGPGRGEENVRIRQKIYPMFSREEGWKTTTYPDNIVRGVKVDQQIARLSAYIEQNIRANHLAVENKRRLCKTQLEELRKILKGAVSKPKDCRMHRLCARFVLNAFDDKTYPAIGEDDPDLTEALRDDWDKAIKGDREKLRRLPAEIAAILDSAKDMVTDFLAKVAKPPCLVHRLEEYVTPIPAARAAQLDSDAKRAQFWLGAAEAYLRVVVDPKLGPYPDKRQWAWMLKNLKDLQEVAPDWEQQIAIVYWNHKWTLEKQQKRLHKLLVVDRYHMKIENRLGYEISSSADDAAAAPPPPPPSDNKIISSFARGAHAPLPKEEEESETSDTPQARISKMINEEKFDAAKEALEVPEEEVPDPQHPNAKNFDRSHLFSKEQREEQQRLEEQRKAAVQLQLSQRYDAMKKRLRETTGLSSAAAAASTTAAPKQPPAPGDNKKKVRHSE
jgi:hypothetical protein